ncbi:hypothetical protein B0T18DRAFT_430652 [Schizothecium vesticola]|uniref:SH3 domain-containing protein n=1 Tax=Schizothecium vesticola TaxID=314040 RepID=A0AA40K298_9PEZI|nr:hypothetical protein B0T18DRAFT_430652 [Schizothecium vesticola]
MGINNPLPSSLASECKKCGKILTSFVDPRQPLGPEKIIPPSVLANAKGLAILTVIKAGFLGSARFGSGLVVARLPDGSWSAPSAIATGGAGFGGQIGFELTDFVFILNDASAVKTFSQAGSLTLGGNVSIAAGPVGRNAEAAGAASLRSVAGIFSYSKTKGLFAGVSLEGSVIVERKDANTKLYGRPVSAKALLAGSEPAPSQAYPLMSILNSRVFSGMASSATATNDGMFNNSPVYDDREDPVVWANKTGDAYGQGQQRHDGGQSSNGGHAYDEFGRPKRASTWRDDTNQGFAGVSRSNTVHDTGSLDKKAPPGRPAAPKPNFQSKQALKKNEAVALFTFEAAQPGDLGFKKGDIITVLKKTESETDWWTGMIGTQHGIFPSNYVKMKE